MWKWPVLALTLLACSDGDLKAPMLGDCNTCTNGPSAGGGISGGGDSGLGFDAGNDDGSFDAGLDAIDIVDVGVSNDAGNESDALDIVDVGVSNNDL